MSRFEHSTMSRWCGRVPDQSLPHTPQHTGVRTSHCSSMKWSPCELPLSYSTLRQKRPAFTNTVHLECRPAQTWPLCLQANHFIARFVVRRNNRDSWAYWETHFQCIFWQFSVIEFLVMRNSKTLNGINYSKGFSSYMTWSCKRCAFLYNEFSEQNFSAKIGILFTKQP